MFVRATHRPPLSALLMVSVFLLFFTQSASAQPPWNHYKVYRPLTSVGFGQPWVLRNQFGPDTVLVKNLANFMNPAEKKLRDGSCPRPLRLPGGFV